MGTVYEYNQPNYHIGLGKTIRTYTAIEYTSFQEQKPLVKLAEERADMQEIHAIESITGQVSSHLMGSF